MQPMYSCADYIFSILRQLDAHQKQVFGAMWSLWKHRNNKFWNNATETVKTFVNESTPYSQVGRNNKVWNDTTRDPIQCNVDASFSNSLNKVSIRVCIMDDEEILVLANT